MTAWRTYIPARLLIAGFLMALALCRADTGSGALTSSEYRAQLDRLLAATDELDSSDATTPQALREVPQSWRVQTDQGEFEISAEGLRSDLRKYESEKNVTNAGAIRRRLLSFKNDLDGFEKPPADVSLSRSDLNSILTRPEFRDVRGPTWFDRFRQRLIAYILHLLERVFRSVAFPTISRVFVYGLMGVAILALLYLLYRSLRYDNTFDKVVPGDVPVSAKEWAIWLAEARAAAAKREWREAIHLAYWAGISFLERQGTWKPDRARTPREYLRLLASGSEHRETLSTLTRIFELAWYAKKDADERTFSLTLQALEKLGCR